MVSLFRERSGPRGESLIPGQVGANHMRLIVSAEGCPCVNEGGARLEGTFACPAPLGQAGRPDWSPAYVLDDSVRSGKCRTAPVSERRSPNGGTTVTYLSGHTRLVSQPKATA